MLQAIYRASLRAGRTKEKNLAFQLLRNKRLFYLLLVAHTGLFATCIRECVCVCVSTSKIMLIRKIGDSPRVTTQRENRTAQFTLPVRCSVF